jgi:hypothetical protein
MVQNMLDWKDGHLCVRYTYTQSDRPERVFIWWPFFRCTEKQARDEYAIGSELRDCRDGIYALQIPGNYRSVTLRLPEGGKTKNLVTETEPVPVPKCRVETRWYSGGWQKYLKSQGWVSA